MSKFSLAALDEIAQQVLGEQDADDLVAVFADHRKARVTRLDHDRQDLLRRIVAIDDDHLRARHHDVAHLQLDDLQHAFEHLEGVGIDDAALLGAARAPR